MKIRLKNKIIKTCGTPEDFTFEYINGASVVSDINRMKEYVKCVNKVERNYKEKQLLVNK